MLQIKSINSYPSKPSFKAGDVKLNQVFNPQQMEKQLKQMNFADADTKKIFAGLTAVATAIITEFSLFVDKDDDIKSIISNFVENIGIDNIRTFQEGITDFLNKNKKEITKKSFSEKEFLTLFNEKPERKNYYFLTQKYFINLNQKYDEMLKLLITEPENIDNKNKLELLEDIFRELTIKNEMKYKKTYFEALDKDYINCLDEVFVNYESTIKNGDTPMHYLVLLNNGTITTDEIKKWTEAKHLGCDEFMLTRFMDKEVLLKLSKLKEKNNKIKISYFDPMVNDKYQQTYAIKYLFDKDLSLTEKLKSIVQVHEAIYGQMNLKEVIDTHNIYFEKDIKTELLDSIVKDDRLDSTFNFVNYINPSLFEKYKLTSADIKLLQKDSIVYNEIQNICSNAILNIDYNSPKMKEFIELLQNDEIFKNLFTTLHSRMRFITRFVLKDNPNSNLTEDCKAKMNILENDINKGTETCNYFCYTSSHGTAPQFYLRQSSLGNYIKITLNRNGSIHTIYEDFYKEQKKREEGAEL